MTEALSHGQLYSWRELETYPSAWLAQANLPATVDLRGCAPGAVRAALARLVARHEVLRMTYSVPDGVPRHSVHAPAPEADPVAGPVTWVERPVTGPEDPERSTAALLARALPMAGAPCWAGEVVTTGGAPMFASFSFSHAIVDVWSVRTLQREFEALLGDGAVVLPAPSAPRILAEQERAPAGRRRQHAAWLYWQGVLAEPGLPVLPTAAPGATGVRIQATLHSHRLGGLAAEAGRRLGVTVPAVLSAMVGAGLAGWLGTDRVVLDLMSSNRIRPEHRTLVGTMNQLVPVVVGADPGTSLGEHVTRVNWGSARAYRHSGYDIDDVLARAGRSFGALFPAWFNYLALDDVGSDPRDRRPAKLEWTPQARPFGQPFDVRVTARGGRISLALRTDPALVPAPGLLALMRGIADGVRRAALCPHDRLGDLGLRGLGRGDLGPVDPALFPPLGATATGQTNISSGASWLRNAVGLAVSP